MKLEKSYTVVIFEYRTRSTQRLHKVHDGQGKMDAEEIITIILDEAFYIHDEIGPGMLESVYQACLTHRLRKRGLIVDVEKAVPVFFEGLKLECGYRADIVVERKVIVDTKNVEKIADIHVAQMLTYLRFMDIRHGLILNFKTTRLKYGIKRVLNGYERSILRST